MALGFGGVYLATRLPVSSTVASELQSQSDTDCPAGSPGADGFLWCVRATGRPGAPVIAVVGDSTSKALDPGMRLEAARQGFRYIQAGQDGCPFAPILTPNNITRRDIAVARECRKWVGRVDHQVQTHERPDVWLVSDRFLLAPIVTENRTVVRPPSSRHARLLLAAVDRQVAQFLGRGANVVLLKTPPRAQPLDCALGRAPRSLCLRQVFSEADPPTIELDGVFDRVASQHPSRVRTVAIDDVLCRSDGVCPPKVDGMLARYDGIHFTTEFSRRIVPLILERAGLIRPS